MLCLVAKLSYDQLFVEKLITASLSENCIASLNLNMAIVSLIDLFVFSATCSGNIYRKVN